MNPFQRSVPIHSSENTSAGSRGTLSSDYAHTEKEINDPAPPPRPPKASISASSSSATTTKKVVRISSPPRSPSPRRDYDGPIQPGAYVQVARQGPNRSFQGRASSSGEDDSSSSSEEEYQIQGQGQGSSKMATSAFPEQRASTNVPHNPFSRTLADMEESLGTSSSGVERAPPEVAESRQPERQGANRATMDVNAFKTLLMTGKTSTSSGETSVAPAQRTAALTLADNSSSTDTSSISRQSIMDNNQPHETPRSSYERSISDSSEDEAAIPQRTLSKRVKPPLPRHRHGKSVSSSGPQIVGFDDFSKFGSEPTPESPVEEVSKSRASGEFKRPLPPVPGPRGAMREALANASRDPSRDPTPSPDTSERPPSQSKKAPPPPLARRSSQRAPAPSLERTKSGTSLIRPSRMDDNESIAESTTSSRMAPAPPPPRRSGHSGNHSERADEGSPASINRTPSLKSPPPPPARNRASSNLSQTSIAAPDLTMTPRASSSGTTVPPKPPPPRRTSSRSSTDFTSPRRTSGEMIRSSFDSERRPSMSSSIRRVPITEDPGESAVITSPTTNAGKDILADMDAFQREIDAMMAKEEIGKRKSSGGSASIQR